jgi:uncharacterized protein (TIGR03089 family)
VQDVTSAPAGVPGLLRRLMADDPGRPRITWYGPGGERVELSAKVLDNWVAKTANLLVDELDAGPGTRVSLALPAHWRTVTWLLAVWSVGACAVVDTDPGAVDVVVSADAAVLAAAGRAVPVAVALPALALGYGPDLPSGAVDAAVGVRTHGDVFVPFVEPTPDDEALVTPAGVTTHGDLLAAADAAATAAGWPAGVRLLTAARPADAVRDVLGPLARLGSVVVHHDLPGLDAAALDALRTQEGVTAPSTP